MQTYDRLVRYNKGQPSGSSATPVPSTESSSTAALAKPLMRSRVDGSGARSPHRDGEDSGGRRSHAAGDPERSRKRRRFSSHPPDDPGSEATASGQDSERRYPRKGQHSRRRHGGLPEMERRRDEASHKSDRPARNGGRRSSERHNRDASRAEHGCLTGRAAASSESAGCQGDAADAPFEKQFQPGGRTNRQAVAGKPAALRSEAELADLRARALAALQARRQVAGPGVS